MKKKYDVVVWGATGFTGKWVAKHLADHYPQEKLSWAIAGRNQTKLREIQGFLELDQELQPDELVADSGDENSLRELVSNTKVIISTVGPYAFYGSLLVALCAELGTDYVDLTGEVPWIRDMIDLHSEAASNSGARIVHSCGFDSIPSDLGVFYTQGQARQKYGEPLKSISYNLLKTKGGASGGTIASMMNVIELAVKDKQIRRLLANPYSLNPDASFDGPDKPDQTSVVHSLELNKWTAPFVMAGINTRIVRRSNALMDFAYGKQFEYSETMVVAAGAKGYMQAKSISAAIKAMMFAGVTGAGRKLLAWFLPAQGEGPVVDPKDPGFYNIQFVGKTAAGEIFNTHLYGDGDPGYGSTSKMLAESAICLAKDSLDTKGGFWTPASAMGDALLQRLQDKGGLTFKVLENS